MNCITQLISTKEFVAKRSAHDDLTNHIRAHLIAAKHEKYADDYDGRLKVTYAAVSRYLNEKGRDLPNKKIRVTGDNIIVSGVFAKQTPFKTIFRFLKVVFLQKICCEF